MPDDFDPYYRWLGIPVAEQPPHLYRLLGLTPFESDPEVIAMAADRQMAHVRMFQSGQYDLIAEGILNELASAQVSLLNKQKKANYDAQLRKELDKSARPAPPVLPPPAQLSVPATIASLPQPLVGSSHELTALPRPSPISSPQPIPVASAQPMNAASSDSPEEYSWPNLSSDSPLVWQLPLAGLVFLLVFVIGWQVTRQIVAMNRTKRPVVVAHVPVETPRRVEPTTEPANESTESFEPPVETPTEAVTNETPTEAVTNETPTEAVTNETPTEATNPTSPPKVVTPSPPVPAVETTRPTEPVVSVPAPNTTPSTSPPSIPSTPTPPDPFVSVTPAASVKRSRIPEEAAIALARKAMLDVYAKDFAAAATLPQRKLLAEKLLQEARKYENDPAGAYAMLKEARGIAIEIGQPKLMLEIIEDSISRFGLDALTTKTAALTEAVPHLKANASHAIIAEQAISLVDEALASENYPVAHQLIDLGLAAAAKAGDRDSTKELTHRQEELAKDEALKERIAIAEQKLAEDPNDVETCLFLGQYYCVAKNDWSGGLALLARATNSPLGNIASADLAVSSDPGERANLGDRWWTYANSDAPGAKDFLRRALYWYKQALPELTGIVQTRVSNRLDEAWTGPSGGPEPAIAPLTATVARERQVKWSQWLKHPVVKTNALGMRLMLIPPGQFRMGAEIPSGAGEERATPKHTVRITKAYYMGATEVTLAQFAAFVKASGYTSELERRRDDENDNDNGFGFPRGRGRGNNNRANPNTPVWLNTPYVQTADHPVVRISWNDAQAFCKWLSQADGAEYQLPTEAQWEYACRAGTESRYFFGDSDARSETFAWHGGNSPKGAQRVGQKRPNAWGVRDAHGNAAEWCADWYGDYSANLLENPTGADSGSARVTRGGSWGDRPLPSSAARERWDPSAGHDRLGFRVICVIDTTGK